MTFFLQSESHLNIDKLLTHYTLYYNVHKRFAGPQNGIISIMDAYLSVMNHFMSTNCDTDYVA